MDTQLVYVEGENIPYTEEQLAERIFAEAADREAARFEFFKRPYTEIDFKCLSTDQKEDKVRNGIAELTKSYQHYDTWRDETLMKAEFIRSFPFRIGIENGRKILSLNQHDIAISNAADLKILRKKKEYLVGLIAKLTKETKPGSKIELEANTSGEEKIKSLQEESQKGLGKPVKANLSILAEDYKYLTRKETAAMLRITLPTLGSWSKSGKLTAYKINGRIRYKPEEIDNALIKKETVVRK